MYISFNIELVKQYQSINTLEENLPRIVDNFVWPNAAIASHDTRYSFWAFPNGPEPGPELPKKKRPKIF